MRVGDHEVEVQTLFCSSAPLWPPCGSASCRPRSRGRPWTCAAIVVIACGLARLIHALRAPEHPLGRLEATATARNDVVCEAKTTCTPVRR